MAHHHLFDGLSRFSIQVREFAVLWLHLSSCDGSNPDPTARRYTNEEIISRYGPIKDTPSVSAQSSFLYRRIYLSNHNSDQSVRSFSAVPAASRHWVTWPNTARPLQVTSEACRENARALSHLRRIDLRITLNDALPPLHLVFLRDKHSKIISKQSTGQDRRTH